METGNFKIIVPYDFTDISDFAVSHAINYSTILKTGITLLHIVKKETEIEEFTEKIQAVANNITKNHDVKVTTVIQEGSIFKTISEVTEEMNSMLVVMGTHGMKGLQKLTGSWALKVIVGSRTPFIVVQAPPKSKSISKVVFPVDFKSESKEKLKWVEFVSTYFKIKTHLLSNASKDGAIDNRTKANVVFSRKYLDDKNIDYELAIVEGSGSFSQETINYSRKIDADLIIVMTTRDIAFHDYVLGAQEQYTIANDAKIPVLVVNPRTDLMKYGYGAIG